MTPPRPAADRTNSGGHFSRRLFFLGWALGSVVLAVISLVLFILTIVSIPLIVVWAGLPLLYAAIRATRPLAAWHRRMAGALLDRQLPAPYVQRGGGNLLIRLRALAVDRATWRDLAWLGANGTAGLALSIVGIVEAVLGLIFWWLPPGMMMRLHAYLAAALLSPTHGTTMAQRVEQLAETRADARDSSAAELRRIERDLHDGAQARLVALGMNLGMADAALDDDPGEARRLIAEARAAASTALAELRDLVRGIHPPVLADRGLLPAVSALALACPIPIEVRGQLADRLPAPVESAAYFVIAEAVGNVIKHSGAPTATVTVQRLAGQLRLTVWDDGRGGADEAAGTGLRGIRRRLAAFDGALDLSSPAGGPTELTMTIPL